MSNSASFNSQGDAARRRDESIELRVVALGGSGPLEPQRGALSDVQRLVTRDLTLYFGRRRILNGVNLAIPAGQVTSLIGPTGSGKSSLLRCLNRMHDFVDDARVEGEVLLDGSNVYERQVDVARLRKRVGILLSETAVFPTTVFENVAYAPRLGGCRALDTLQEKVRQALTQADLWDEMRNRLDERALALSPSQQFRLCIARSLAAEPEVLMMDEPTMALDPAATARVEELIVELKQSFTVVLVTNNIQQAARVADRTAFLLQGELVEAGATTDLFTGPSDPRTDDYIRGRFS